MTKINRRAPTEEEKQWQINLLRIWNEQKVLRAKTKNPITYEKCAESMTKTAGLVGQYVRGNTKLNTGAIVKFAEYLGVPPGKIDPKLLNIKPVAGIFNDTLDDTVGSFQGNVTNPQYSEQVRYIADYLKKNEEELGDIIKNIVKTIDALSGKQKSMEDELIKKFLKQSDNNQAS